ncbi:phosphate ABC transporter substrate-binding protein [Cyanosarcina cf. burmensis CCALA 770]|nr:phosphate ABC transporter substrate-binding protein [Cyanosarcina cf. burmensis CCALA 770]
MSRLNKLKLVSYLAPNMFEFYQAVGVYLSRVLDVETQIIQSQSVPLQDPAILQDQLDLAFICGLPFIQLSQLIPDRWQALVAPVMQAQRYHNRPVYFSDVIVNANSSFKSFDDLAAKTLCFNDLGSNSGYNLIRHRLLQSGYPSYFFAQVIPSGSHQHSIRLVIAGKADCAAIDSTVLEQELHISPQLSNDLRVVESIGPCPMPPVVGSRRLGATKLDQIQLALCQPDRLLQEAMERARIQCYVEVRDSDYAPIGTMYARAIQAGYEQLG